MDMRVPAGHRLTAERRLTADDGPRADDRLAVGRRLGAEMATEGFEANFGSGRLVLGTGDITKDDSDAIVNAANSGLMGGGGVDGAIHRAGGPAILDECKEIVARQGRLPTGQAVITTAGRLVSRHVIHTVGPIWRGGNSGEPESLRSCYSESLKLALAHGIKTIAFPSISTGVYGYPTELAAPVALGACADFLSSRTGIEEIRFVLFDETTYRAYEKSLRKIADKQTGREV